MTKILLKSESALLFDILGTPLRILLHPTIIAYHRSRDTVYVDDSYAERTLSRFSEAGIPFEAVKV